MENILYLFIFLGVFVLIIHTFTNQNNRKHDVVNEEDIEEPNFNENGEEINSNN